VPPNVDVLHSLSATFSPPAKDRIGPRQGSSYPSPAVCEGGPSPYL